MTAIQQINTTAIAIALVQKDYTTLKELLKDYPATDATEEEMRVKKMKIREILRLLE